MNKVFKLLFSAALLLCCFAASAAGTQPSTGDGSQANPYQITTADNLVWFAEHVNSGNTTACAKLTADITVNAGVLDSNGNLNSGTFTSWTPIGGFNGGGNDYSGEFDGNGHTISGLYFNDESVNNIGLFGKAVGNAHIHDLGVSDSYFCGKDHVGGICGDFANGVIEYCYSTGTIYALNGDGGGLTGSCFTNAHIRQCHTSCAVTAGAGNYGGITGYLWGGINHCCVMEGKNAEGHVFYGGKTDDSVFADNTAHSEAAFASGEVCWLLNNGVTGGSQKWYQTLNGTDNFPVLDNSHGTVYYGYDGNVLTYSNSPLVDPSNKASYIDTNGNLQVADNVTEITNSSSTLNAGWYVVTGADVQTGSLNCNGAVHLILADGAKLTAAGGYRQAGVTVSGNGNSLTIYGQSAQSGQLIAKGGRQGAGIGGGREQSGSNITINGGKVTAIGVEDSAGIGGGGYGSGSNIIINGGNVIANGGVMDGVGGAGIGGGFSGSGYNIFINGGTVTANVEGNASGIGGGWKGSGSNIKVATSLTVYADNTNPPTSEILHTSDYDIAPNLAGKRYAVVKDVAIGAKEAAIAAINAAIEGVTNEDIIAIATNVINAINAATSVETVNAIKEQALAAIAALKSAYASALGEMGEPCEDCPSVEVTGQNDNMIKLYNPKSVTFKKE